MALLETMKLLRILMTFTLLSEVITLLFYEQTQFISAAGKVHGDCYEEAEWSRLSFSFERLFQSTKWPILISCLRIRRNCSMHTVGSMHVTDIKAVFGANIGVNLMFNGYNSAWCQGFRRLFQASRILSTALKVWLVEKMSPSPPA